MKKIIAAMAAMFICVSMLSACSNDAENADAGTSSETTASETAGTTEGTAQFEEENEPEGTAKPEVPDGPKEPESPEEPSAAVGEDGREPEAPAGNHGGTLVASFASFDELAEADFSALIMEQINDEESYTYEFLKTLEGADGFYLDVESTDGTMSMSMAFSGQDLAMNVKSTKENVNLNILLSDMMLYILDPSTKTGLYYQVDESIFNEYSVDSALGQISIDKESLENSSELNSCMIRIGGKDYILESASGSGFVFEPDGNLCAIVSTGNSSERIALMVNEFSGKVPANAFDVPSGYELIDFMAALAGFAD